MRTYLVAYLAGLAVFLAGDVVWLGSIAIGFYRSRLGDLLLERPNLAVAAGFYALYLVGVVIFAVAPALRSGTWTTATLYGALFGLFAYATYDLTNLATLRHWSAAVSLLDIAWGIAITALSATLATLAASRFG
jgi:uncharacterized membrane protein